MIKRKIMKKIIYGIILIAITLGLTGCENAKPYPQRVQTWKSYTDVANYMQSNFRFDRNRQLEFKKDLRKYKQKTDNMYDFTVSELSKKPIETYNSGSGFCGDSVVFINDALNKVNPNYKAKTIFIENGASPIHHWVTGFYVKDKLYIMDYGAGSKWSAMIGTHGPYNSIDDYGDFLKSINVRGFKFNSIRWRN